MVNNLTLGGAPNLGFMTGYTGGPSVDLFFSLGNPTFPAFSVNEPWRLECRLAWQTSDALVAGSSVSSASSFNRTAAGWPSP
jgi:hypothetical protein